MKIRVIMVILLLALGTGLGIIIDKALLTPSQATLTNQTAHQVRQGGYSLINPLLECEIGEKTLSKAYISFRYKVEDEVNQLKANGSVDDMSIYFRDLNNGIGFGVNEKEGFAPASLLKVPEMIAYYKKSETDPDFFNKKLTYSDPLDRNMGETIKPRQSMIKGKEYTVEDLLYRMIVFSDNNAMALLVENLPLPIQDKVFTDIGITIPGVRGTDDFMSVTDNASFFRILFNASYLEKDTSQKALELLTKVDFTQGIRAGVPRGVPVANKFGERLADGRQQLHDCGIVYYKDHPYLLCMMSRGPDFKKLASSLEDISRLVYSEVRRQN